MFATVPDLLRLLVVPVLGWAAWRDVETRRVPSVTWYPLVALGVVLLAWDALGHLSFATLADRLFFVRVGVSLLFVAPLSYAFWYLGGFGGADAKALITFSILLPTFPTYYLPGIALPAEATTLGVFSMTILTNTVIFAVGYPLAMAVRNVLDGDTEIPLLFFGRRIATADLSTAHGRLFETPDGYTRNGLDIDALRMYLRWRGTTLAALRDDPEGHRDPASISQTYDPTDGAVGDGVATDGGVAADAGSDADAHAAAAAIVDAEDPWGAEAFLDSIEGSAYGTTPEKLRGGLDVVTTTDEVWISPGIPFLVPMFFGTVVAFTYGDVLFGAVGALGIV
ncbi:A24 family peptidase [Halopelagius longus]|uniref:Preflagellin peptidase FlaK n=1 Tax=Halopelagius longus TaxID=1236180 RepID=A0A1H1ES57_9EURY|nr:A24 family peptidase [Halopelagius longus]RDI71871.1 prepilin peptidase [Halopelagius longus]SDQ91583.1 preflagellin peptidase FlaK [Halopelagius longus]